MRVIISGGGTGGHVFPAIAIANAIKEKYPESTILFVGAKGKLEMEKVPKAGYEIIGLWISGFHRKLTFRNLLFPIRVIHSLWKARGVIRRFRPDVVVGVGGYASGPVLQIASMKGIPALIQEQNSYAGITNRLLAKKVQKICVAYNDMERFFPKEKIIFTGNPVRKDILANTIDKESAKASLGIAQNKKTVLIFGGSLGARSLNEAVSEGFEIIKEHEGINFIWQVGKLYYDTYKDYKVGVLPNVKVLAFIDKMDEAYAAADIIVCRAGALTISELAIIAKPAILLPSPNVAEDHQTKNAMALVDKEAAMMVKDAEGKEKLIPQTIDLLFDEERKKQLSANIKTFARPDAAETIAEEVRKLVD